jgi:hypothetical protein
MSELTIKKAFLYPFKNIKEIFLPLYFILFLGLIFVMFHYIDQLTSLMIDVRVVFKILGFLGFLSFLALFGYKLKIIDNFYQGNFEKTPEFKLKKDFFEGGTMFFKMIPLFLVFSLLSYFLANKWIGLNIIINYISPLFVMAPLFINLFIKKEFKASFDFKVLSQIYKNFFSYLLALIKEIFLFLIVLFICAFIFIGTTLIVTGNIPSFLELIPAKILVSLLVYFLFTCNYLVKNIFIIDFFKKKIK